MLNAKWESLSSFSESSPVHLFACDVAFKADSVDNGFFASLATTRAAVAEAKSRIALEGALYAYLEHSVSKQKRRDPSEAVALVNDIVFDESTGVVSLPRLTLLESQCAGKVRKLLSKGKRLGISARLSFDTREVVGGTSARPQNVKEMLNLAFLWFDVVSSPMIPITESFIYPFMFSVMAPTPINYTPKDWRGKDTSPAAGVGN